MGYRGTNPNPFTFTSMDEFNISKTSPAFHRKTNLWMWSPHGAAHRATAAFQETSYFVGSTTWTGMAGGKREEQEQGQPNQCAQGRALL